MAAIAVAQRRAVLAPVNGRESVVLRAGPAAEAFAMPGHAADDRRVGRPSNGSSASALAGLRQIRVLRRSCAVAVRQA
jgi:hypothetical protein